MRASLDYDEDDDFAEIEEADNDSLIKFLKNVKSKRYLKMLWWRKSKFTSIPKL
jgi:hypothetical protein